MRAITVTISGNTITVTDGARTRHSSCASPASAKSLATRLKNDPSFARKWMKVIEPVQLDLPFERAVEHD